MKHVKKLLWLIFCQWWMNDLRFGALALLVLSTSAGWLLNTEAHALITVIVVLGAALGISLAYQEAKKNTGTSGSTGIFYLSIIGAVVILVPLWVWHWVKAWLY